jgi:hypothetical protein
MGVSSAVETTIPAGTKLEINGIAVAPLREDAGVLEAVIVTVILSTGGHSN